MFLGVFAAYKYTSLVVLGDIRPAVSGFGFRDIVTLAIIILILFFILKKFPRVFGNLMTFFLILVIFSGSQIIGGIFLNSPFDLIFGLVVTVAFMTVKNVLMYNLAMIIGLSGVGSILGIGISPNLGVVLLIVFSIYDILAVYWTGHMVDLAKGMIKSGAIFGFVIPFKFGDFFYHKGEAREKIGDSFMILGSGDVGLPLIMASSVAVLSLSQALIVASFSMVGLLITHLIFHNQTQRKPMAALPPIATMTIIGYVISMII